MQEHARDKYYPHYSEKYKYVTTWCSQQFPSFDADKIIKFMREKNPDMKETDQEIKNRWKETAKHGKMVHLEIERFYKKNIIAPETTLEFNQFQNFVKHNNFTPIRSEWKIYDETLRICGCLDMLYKDENTNEIIICDWKTTKELKFTNKYEFATTECIKHLPNSNFWHYTLQLNYYKYILETKYNIIVDKLIIVCFLSHKYSIWNVPILKEEILSLNELIIS